MNQAVASQGMTVRAARALRFADRAAATVWLAWRSLVRAVGPNYRPEEHYMRGPGPKWHARNSQTFGAINGDLHRRNNSRAAKAAR